MSLNMRKGLAFCFVPLASGFEWAGIFETPLSLYKWSAEKVDGAYVDPGMKIVLIPAMDHEEETLHGFEDAAETAMASSCVAKNSGDTLVPQTGTCYQLTFDTTEYRSMFNIDAVGVDNVAIFAEHFPTEFEQDSHYLKDTTGEDIEPLHEIPEPPATTAAPEPEKPWGAAIGGSVLVNLCTLLGVIFIVPFFGNFAKKNPDLFLVTTSGLSAGALISAAFLLLLFEGTHLVASDDEAVDTAVWGCSIMGGFIIGSVIDTIALAGKVPKAVNDDDSGKGEAEDAEGTSRVRVLSGCLVGDFVHNFCDGVFIASAFMGCGDSFGWKVAGASIYHEVFQEIADYFVLTNPEQGNLKPITALALNFVSGLGVILGAIVILAQDEVDNLVTGVLLAIGGGVYVQIGACECMGRVYVHAKTPGLRMLGLALFMFAAACIGLVLLDHEHCVPEVAAGAAEGGGGHGHGGH